MLGKEELCVECLHPLHCAHVRASSCCAGSYCGRLLLRPAPTAAGSGYGRLRPSFSCAATHSSQTTAAPSEISPHSTVAATISASFRTFPAP